MKLSTIVVAGGSGSRMGTSTPKQFLLLGGLPILMHTIVALSRAVDKYVNNFIIVLPPDQINRWKELCTQHNFTTVHQIATGGATRFDSVRSGLAMVKDVDIVLIHDGVRPFVDADMVEQTIRAAALNGAAIPAIDMVDSMRRIVDNSSEIVNRAKYRSVQTPQVFRYEILKKAYTQPFDPAFTDDASVVESTGHPITLTQGNPQNIKITTQSDIQYANYLLQNRTKA